MKINAICGGIYASGIAGLSFLKKHSNILQKKTHKSTFRVLWETVSERSGENATLFACDRCPPYSVLQFAI